MYACIYVSMYDHTYVCMYVYLLAQKPRVDALQMEHMVTVRQLNNHSSRIIIQPADRALSLGSMRSFL